LIESHPPPGEPGEHDPPRRNKPGRIVLLAVLLSAIVVKLVPFFPRMPASGLDPSWMYAVDEAVAKGLAFGRDVVWVHGPLTSVYTHSYHPATYPMAVAASLFLALCYWALLVALLKDSHWLWIVAFCLALLGLNGDPDPLLFTLPLLVGLLVDRVLSAESPGWVEGALAPVYVVALFSPLGVLPLIKGSLLPLCAVVALACALLFVAKGRPWLAVASLASPLATLLLLWAACGQPLNALASYFSTTAELTAGWAQGIGYSPDKTGRGAAYLWLEIGSYVLAAAALVGLIVYGRRPRNVSKLFVAALFSAILFLAFKAGFVIHDEHALIAGETILVCALLFASQLRISKMVVVVLLLASLAYLLPEVHYAYLLGRGLPGTGYAAAARGITNDITDPGWLDREFETAVSSLRDEAAFPVLEGRSDIYSYDQSYLISSGNTWDPRPVLQSHTAYTPALAELDRQYLLADDAPDNVFFAIQPVFGRLPSLEDGPSWSLLIRDYQPLRIYGEHLALRRTSDAGLDEPPDELATTTHVFGESVSLPTATGPLFAHVDIKPTLIGRVSNALYKPAELRINLQLSDGTTRQYTLVAGMANAGFVISPLVESTADFQMLFEPAESLDAKAVKSIVIDQARLTTRVQAPDWHERYTLRLSRLPISP